MPLSSVAIRAEPGPDGARVVVEGPLDLDHVMAAAEAFARVETMVGARRLEIDLARVTHIDGSGAVVVADFLDRAGAASVRVIEGPGGEAGRLIARYQRAPSPRPDVVRRAPALTRFGSAVARTPAALERGFDFLGRSVVALPAVARAPRSVDWPSVLRLVERIGADGLPVTGAANLLVGLIIGFLGVSQLRRFGAVAYVPELVTVTQLRELGPLVTAIVVAGRSGAGVASEIATMKVSEEIDALRSLGLDPIRWLVVPRCLALMVSVPALTWLGNALALGGGLCATTAMTSMSPHAYVTATADAITAANFLTGMIKTPFLALAIGLIACGEGLATYGGAAAVGKRTTTAVVWSIFAVIVISAAFTGVFAFLGV